MDTRFPDGHELTLSRASGRYAFLTRDGLVSKTTVRPAETALVETLGDADGDAVVLGADFGVVPTLLARETGCRPTAVTTSARAADCCRVNADRNDAAVGVTLDAWVPVERADHLLYAPADAVPAAVARERLARGVAATAAGGTVAVAAPDPDGVAPFRAVFDRCCRGVTRERVGDATVLSGRRADGDPETGLEPNSFRATVGEYTCRFLTLPGLFSWRGVDDGTAALLEAVSVADGDRVLDLACGYGAVGAFVGARTDCRLYATDDDALATRFARRNYERNGVDPQTVVTADGLDGFDDESFDTVVANPPTHAGSGVTRKLFAGVADRLTPDGAFWLVYNEVMGYDYTLRTEYDLAVDVVAASEGFEVAVARPN
ncbi:class I SAM-dependent methyltransferase [Halobaculum sp. MBLA0143]|uniref:class I SAM-dependent methyltransferase n=1 Tax=Halobaculum sp. MBLA0143 TaxID=3079933 RepID=UPI003523FF80